MSPRPPQADEPRSDPGRPERPDRDERLGSALSDLPVPDHGPTFWADLDHRLQGDTVPHTESATDAGPDQPTLSTPALTTPTTGPAAVSLDERRDRRAARRGGGRFTRSLGAAAAAVALVVAAAGALTVVNRDDKTDREVRAADRPAGTAQPGPTTPTAPAEFSATYDGIEGWDGPDGCCRTWRLTVARDGSFRWTSTDSSDDMAYDATTGRHVEIVSRGPGTSKERPNAFIATGVPAGGPDQRVAKPDPLGPMADFITALARAGDPRIASTSVAGRPAWHYDGPTVQDRLGGEGAPNYAIADVDQATGAILDMTIRVDETVITRFTASDITTSDQIDRARYRLDPPSGANVQNLPIGFAVRSLDDAAAEVPYDLLVPGHVPDGFTLDWAPSSVTVNGEVASPTGPEGGNPPTTPVVSMTWRKGAGEFTVSLRPTGGQPWDDPFGAEGMVPDKQPVRLELPGRPALEGQLIVEAPLRPHLWGITGDVVVTVSGDLSRAELEQVAGSLRPHRHG
ncbi:MAG: hypothetical protein AB1679_36365 [Actinomycetota bacterium]|jgi:hypothetical protein